VRLFAALIAAMLGLTIKPGVERWPVKIRPSHGESRFVFLTDLLAMPPPPNVKHNDKRYQRKRIPATIGMPTEGELIITSGYLRLAALEPDGDYHLQLSVTPVAPEVVIVEIPDQRFVLDDDLKANVATARAAVRGFLGSAQREPSSSGSLLSPPPFVCVAGALFHDISHLDKDGTVQARGKKHMHAPSIAEIHPVEAIWVSDSIWVSDDGECRE
jgi:hypothetical protein